MPTGHAEDEFDWVATQSQCTTESMFAKLIAGIRIDVERRNNLTGREDAWRFELHEEEGVFEVARVQSEGFGPSRTLAFVTFAREGKRINVHGDGVDVDFTVIVTLNPSGECRFIVGEAEYAGWEIRRLALEQLFFDEEEEEP